MTEDIKLAKPKEYVNRDGLECFDYYTASDINIERKEWQKALDKEKAHVDIAKKTAQEFEERYIDRGIEIEKEKKRADEYEQKYNDASNDVVFIGAAGVQWQKKAEKAEALIKQTADELERISSKVIGSGILEPQQAEAVIELHALAKRVGDAE